MGPVPSADVGAAGVARLLRPWASSAASRSSVENPPSYGFRSDEERDLAARLTKAVDHLAAIAEAADVDALRKLVAQPRPKGAIRRIPTIQPKGETRAGAREPLAPSASDTDAPPDVSN